MRFMSNKFVPQTWYQRLQTRRMIFGKLLGWQVFKNQNCNPFQSSLSLFIRASFCIVLCYSYLFFTVLRGYFYVWLNLVTVSTALILIIFVRTWSPAEGHVTTRSPFSSIPACGKLRVLLQKESYSSGLRVGSDKFSSVRNVHFLNHP